MTVSQIRRIKKAIKAIENNYAKEGVVKVDQDSSGAAILKMHDAYHRWFIEEMKARSATETTLLLPPPKGI